MAMPASRVDRSLGSDDFRARMLKFAAMPRSSDTVRAQLDVLARFGAVVLALAERRGAMAELSSIIEATKRLNSTLDLGELIHIILQIATRQTGAERGTVFLLDSARQEMWSLVGLGLDEQVIRFPVDRGIAGWVAREGTRSAGQCLCDSRFEPEIDRQLGFTTRALMCLPIRNDSGAIIGVLELLNKADAFTAEDEAFLDALSTHVALALEKAQLHRARIEKEKMERDLALAREIQAGFLPKRRRHGRASKSACRTAHRRWSAAITTISSGECRRQGSFAAGRSRRRRKRRGLCSGDGQCAGHAACAGRSRRTPRTFARHDQPENSRRRPRIAKHGPQHQISHHVHGLRRK